MLSEWAMKYDEYSELIMEIAESMFPDLAADCLDRGIPGTICVIMYDPDIGIGEVHRKLISFEQMESYNG